jgi:hypothetical protein
VYSTTLLLCYCSFGAGEREKPDEPTGEQTAWNAMRKVKIMLVLLAVISFFTSCEKQPENVSKQYSITWNRQPGYENTVVILECNDVGDVIYNHSTSFRQGMTKTFSSQPTSTKVKIHVTINSVAGNTVGYVQQVFYLSPNQTTSIVINENTLIGNNQP